MTRVIIANTIIMKIVYDPKKNAANIAKHGVSFEDAHGFDFIRAHYEIDARKDYGEIRQIATGYYTHRLYVLCFVEIHGGIRAISFRKANARERKKYEKRSLH